LRVGDEGAGSERLIDDNDGRTITGTHTSYGKKSSLDSQIMRWEMSLRQPLTGEKRDKTTQGANVTTKNVMHDSDT